ncbi:PREDICTED: repressor of RNA polymerase III transcription MAF1 homolog [Brassica oleracea var. oleracea]|uniref:Repressor of RNA polymerase III transcription n=1 Tax=Brassica oleracea var. oleracea TaxID=109376 RepID=A0A0D3AIT3_BRAOL|nr:PREDICTED: repressor of RNA polymerase III transcription MAF1 homolog [Brassica oleracea var. oleracea]
MGHLNLGERTIKGCLEAYSCKHAGTDKRLSLNLENEMLDYLEKSSDSDSSSPVDLLLSRSSRKALIYLVLTLYQMYPDYDFSAVKAHQFFSEESWDTFTQIFSNYMFEASKVVKLAECEIYVYNPNPNADPFLEEGAINLAYDAFLSDTPPHGEDDEEIFEDMDM